MDPNGSQWIPMDPNGSKWIQMEFNLSKLIPTDPNESQWIPMDPNGSQWIPIDPMKHPPKTNRQPWSEPEGQEDQRQTGHQTSVMPTVNLTSCFSYFNPPAPLLLEAAASQESSYPFQTTLGQNSRLCSNPHAAAPSPCNIFVW